MMGALKNLPVEGKSYHQVGCIPSPGIEHTCSRDLVSVVSKLLVISDRILLPLTLGHLCTWGLLSAVA